MAKLHVEVVIHLGPKTYFSACTHRWASTDQKEEQPPSGLPGSLFFLAFLFSFILSTSSFVKLHSFIPFKCNQKLAILY